MIRVGILDSGIGNGHAPDGDARAVAGPAARVARRAVFGAGSDALAPASFDLLGHGTQIAAIIARAAPGCELLDARIFIERLRCAAEQAAAGIDWLVEQRARLINMSFGLGGDRAALREACARARARGVLLVASSPARGAAVFPAAYPGVIRATGDARCAPGEISFLGTSQADFGAHVRAPDGRAAGASIGCAHLSAAIAALLQQHPEIDETGVRAALTQRAAYHGPERIRAPLPHTPGP